MGRRCTDVTQSKLHSFLEASINVSIGWALSVVVGQLIIYPMFDIPLSLVENMGATAMFTLVSVIKAYYIRRTANWWQHHRGEK